MQFELGHDSREPEGTAWMRAGGRLVRLSLRRDRRAKRYVLRVGVGGQVRVTIPRGGSARDAQAFAAKQEDWVLKQLLLHATSSPAGRRPWEAGATVMFRGSAVPLKFEMEGGRTFARLGSETIPVQPGKTDYRDDIERHLRGVAEEELPRRTRELGCLHGVAVRCVRVRNQKSRWGSCSRRGTVSLNWRLVQAPETVRDYIILHELAHFREMNHSIRFWKEVEALCPDYRAAEDWIKKFGRGIIG